MRPSRSWTGWRCSAARWSTRSARSGRRAPRTSACTSRASAIRTAAPCCAKLHADGTIQPLAVEGLGDDWWMLAEDVERLQTRRLQAAHRAAVARSTTCSATARAPRRCSASTTGSRSTPRSPSAAGATSCSRSSTATGSSRRADLAMDRKRDTLRRARHPRRAEAPARRAPAEGDRSGARRSSRRGAARRTSRFWPLRRPGDPRFHDPPMLRSEARASHWEVRGGQETWIVGTGVARYARP